MLDTMKLNLSRRTLIASLASLPLLQASARAEVLKPTGGDQTAALQAAITAAGETGGVVQLGAGTFETGPLTLKNNITLQGIPGATALRSIQGGKILSIRSAKRVVIEGIEFTAKGKTGNLLTAEGIERLIVQDCDFAGAEAALRVATCGGRIVGNRMRFHQKVACQAIGSTGLEISGNSISDIGNAGIQVWRENKGDSPTIVTNNFVTRIAAEDGGDGPNGNGINVFAAHGVIVSNNRITDCAFTGIRNASSDACIITGNNIARCNEVALYVEFEFLGAVVANNIIDTAAHGIAITNFLQGGRVAQCTGNVVRNIKGTDAHGRSLGGGIAAEADTVIANNVVENAEIYGIGMGWGIYGRNLSTTGNIVKDCPQGIRFSAVGPGPYVIANNVIAGASKGAILGMDHDKPITDDLALAGSKIPDQASITGNMVRS
jgi:uncharacterized secreted repeat protein (TIGR03808 family)